MACFSRRLVEASQQRAHVPRRALSLRRLWVEREQAAEHVETEVVLRAQLRRRSHFEESRLRSNRFKFNI